VVRRNCKICRHCQFDFDFTLLCIYKGGVVNEYEAENCEGFDVLACLEVDKFDETNNKPLKTVCSNEQNKSA